MILSLKDNKLLSVSECVNKWPWSPCCLLVQYFHIQISLLLFLLSHFYSFCEFGKLPLCLNGYSLPPSSLFFLLYSCLQIYQSPVALSSSAAIMTSGNFVSLLLSKQQQTGSRECLKACKRGPIMQSDESEEKKKWKEEKRVEKTIAMDWEREREREI